MHCWHCSESYHFVGVRNSNHPQLLENETTSSLPFDLENCHPNSRTKKAMKIPGMPTLHCFIAVENDVLWRQINKCYSFKEVTFLVPSVVHIHEGLSAFKKTYSYKGGLTSSQKFFHFGSILHESKQWTYHYL